MGSELEQGVNNYLNKKKLGDTAVNNFLNKQKLGDFKRKFGYAIRIANAASVRRLYISYVRCLTSFYYTLV